MLTAGMPHRVGRGGLLSHHLPRAAGCKGRGSASSVRDPPQAAFLSAPLQFSLAACVSTYSKLNHTPSCCSVELGPDPLPAYV